MSLFIRNARALTLAGGDAPRRGRRLGNLGVIGRADVLVSGDRIVAVEPVGEMRPPAGVREIDARGRVVMPGFVDPHTHASWAGDRLDEWERKLKGESYLDILHSGGGIMSTVRAVRRASQATLEEGLRARLALMLREGTTTVEVKSGYGLSTSDELKMLRAIAAARGDVAAAPSGPAASWRRTERPAKAFTTVVATALLGHAIDADAVGGRAAFVTKTIEETLPAVTREFPGAAIDAFCEEGAWTRDECVRLFEAALGAGHDVRIHADQFTSLGMVAWAAANAKADGSGARVRCVDHLEATSDDDLRRLAESGVFGVALPCTGWQTDGRYMNARAFLEAGGALALATNCNPGSAPTSSMPFAIALAVRHLGLTPGEAIAACTANAAALLGFNDRGILAPGKRQDLILLRHTDERALAYEFGGNPVELVTCAGQIVAETT